MQRGFLASQYGSGKLLSSPTSHETDSTTKTASTTVVPANLGDGREHGDGRTAPSLTQLLDEMKIHSAKEDKLLRGSPEVSPQDIEDELFRIKRREPSFGHVRSLYFGSQLWTVFLFLDARSKDAFFAQMKPFAATEPYLTNLLQTRSTSTAGTFSVMKSDVTAGQLLLFEFPIVTGPSAWLGDNTIASLQSVLQRSIEMLTPERQSAFKSLYNAWSGYTGTDPRGQGVFTGIYNTNALAIRVPDDKIIKYCAVFGAFSRLNHSCSPTAYWRWDMPSCAMGLRALFPLAAGDKVTISYISNASLLEPSSKRRAELRDGYRFECMCNVCGGSAAEVAASDARRAELAHTAPPRRFLFLVWVHGAGPESILIDISLRVCELYDRERLLEPVYDSELWTHSAQLMYCYLALGVEDKARMWAYRVLVRALVVVQDRSSTIVREAERTFINPKRSPVWNARTMLKHGGKLKGLDA